MRDFSIRKYLDFNKKSIAKKDAGSAKDRTPVPLPEIGEGENFIFISYSHADCEAVYRDLEVMKAAGVRFWYDQGLAAGSNWDDEVERIMNTPGCCGVIFYLSENLFLSASANKEIKFVCPAADRRNKNFFCVNLTPYQPSGILRSAMLSVRETAVPDMDHIAVLANAFSDKQTYLSYNDPRHAESLIGQIADRFNVIAKPRKMSAVFDLMPEGTQIKINREAFYIGRNERKCHFTITENYVSSLHAAVLVKEGGFFLSDMNSSNGTFLNGSKLEPDVPVLLKDGDKISIGAHTLIFRLK